MTDEVTPHHLGVLMTDDAVPVLAQPARDDAVLPGGGFYCIRDNPGDTSGLGFPSVLRTTDIDVFNVDADPPTELTVVEQGELWMANPSGGTFDVRLNALEWSPGMDGATPILFGAGYTGIRDLGRGNGFLRLRSQRRSTIWT